MDEVAVLQELVSAYSPSGREADAVRRFTRIAQSLGFQTEVDGAGNGIARRGSGRPQVLFLGHIDTVPGEIPVRIARGRIHGRGTCDAKGALAAALLAGASHEGPGEIAVVAAVREERDSAGARFLVPRHRPDHLIVGEPSGWEGITVGYKGILSLVLTFEGERTHLSSPHPTAVEDALGFVTQLRAFVGGHPGPTPYSSLTAKVHTVNTRHAGGKDIVRVGVSLRLPAAVKSEEVLRFLEDGGAAGAYRIVDRSEAVEVDPRNPVARALCAGIRESGGRPTLLRKCGTADLNLVAPAWQCPAAVYGPGNSHLDHTDAESLDLDEFRRSVCVLRTAFSALTAGGGESASSRAALAHRSRKADRASGQA
jgi:LysW-gamma-L-lysine carboxypeptidase